MSDLWDPLGEAKGCLNYISGCSLYAGVAGLMLGLAVLFVEWAQFGRWEHLRFWAGLLTLAILLVPWIVYGIWRQKEWYRILWECMGVGLAALVFSSAVIPNIHPAPNRGRQKRTVADMKIVAEKMEAFRENQGSYPAFHDLENFGRFFHFAAPEKDGWGRPFTFNATDKEYWMISFGRDGKPDVPVLTSNKEGATGSFDDDLVLHNGKFTRFPEGVNPDRLK